MSGREGRVIIVMKTKVVIRKGITEDVRRVTNLLIIARLID